MLTQMAFSQTMPAYGSDLLQNLYTISLCILKRQTLGFCEAFSSARRLQNAIVSRLLLTRR